MVMGMVAAPFGFSPFIANRRNPRAGNRQRAGLRLGIIQSEMILPLCKIISAAGGRRWLRQAKEQKEKRGAGKQRRDETDH